MTMHLFFPDNKPLTARRGLISNFLFVVLFSLISWLPGCGDVSTAPAPSTPTVPAPLPGALTITTTTLPDGTANLPYAGTVGGSGGITPYTWSVTPSLPTHLTFNQTTGTINGTPAAQGNSTHTFTLQDSSSPVQTVQQSISLTINTTPAVLSINTTSLPDGAVGQSYDQTVRATGGTGALMWNVDSGTLPQNMNLNSTSGAIAGTPTAPGTSSFTVRVADTAGQADTQALSIFINSPTPPSILTTTLPGGTVSQPYSQTVQASGGTGTLVWSRSAGSLPANLSLNSDGTISGTPTNTGTSNFTVRVTDALSQSDTRPFSITISPAPSPLTITTNSLQEGRRNQFYTVVLTASGGNPPYTWFVSPALPSGLTLAAATGIISGSPTATSNINHTFTVRDSTNQTTTKQLNLRIRN